MSAWRVSGAILVALRLMTKATQGRLLMSLVRGVPVGLSLFALAWASMVSMPAWADDQELEEIVVTAQKRTERLQDVPLPVSAVTGDQLRSAGVANAQDLRFASPSVNYGSSANTRGEGIQVRGVGTQIFGDGVEQSVGVVVDGVAMGRNGMGIADMVDVERIEVLRGPQGMLFGKNASAGLINIITRAPVLGENSLAVSASYATLDDLRLAATGNLALGEDYGLRVTYQRRTREGYVRNIVRNEDLNDIENQSVRARFKARFTEDVQLLVVADYSDSNTLCCTWTARTAPATTPFGALNAAAGIVPGPENLRNAAGARFFQNQENWGVSGQLDWDFGWASLTTIAAYRYWFAEDNNDPDILPINVLDRNVGDSKVDQRSVEARLTSPGGQPLEWTVGVFYLSMDNVGGNLQAGTLGLSLPGGGTLGADRRSTTENRSKAVFATLGYTFFEKLKITGGLRYTDEVLRVDWQQVQASGTIGTIPGRFYGTATGRRDTDNVSWRITGQYNFTDDIMAYAGIARGYKGPAYDQGLVNSTVVFTNPEIPTTYEAGLRMQFDRLATVNLALFNTNFKDFQAQVFDQNVFPSRFTTANAGKLRSRGIELEFVLRPFDGFTLSGNAAHIDSEYTDFQNVACYPGQPQSPFGTVRTSPRQCIRIISATGPFVTEATGNPLTNSPKWTGNLKAAYEQDIGGSLQAFVSGNIYHRSSVSFSAAGDPLLRERAYTLLGAEIGIGDQDGRWRVTVFGRNLGDKNFVNNVISQPVLGAAGVSSQFPSADARRIIGVAFDYKFGGN
jgi:iron complex outermembrane recepter protein